MDEKNIGKADILGFSDGGNIAMVFAIRYPERVNRLILNGANLDASGVKRSAQIPIEIGYRIAKIFAGKSDTARLNAEMLGLMVNDPNVDPKHFRDVRKMSIGLMPNLIGLAGSKEEIDSLTKIYGILIMLLFFVSFL